MADKLAECLFCFRQDWVLWRSESMFIQLDDAPLCEGHLLVCPELHYESMADVPTAALPEFETVFDRLRDFYPERYGTFGLFEHGRTGHCIIRTSAERVCHHAHVHVLPLAGDLITRIELGQLQRFVDWSEVPDLAADVDGYIVAESMESGRFFYPVTRALPPHYLRTVAADMLGSPEIADWEVVIGNRRSYELMRRAYDFLAEGVAGVLTPKPAVCSSGSGLVRRTRRMGITTTDR